MSKAKVKDSTDGSYTSWGEVFKDVMLVCCEFLLLICIITVCMFFIKAKEVRTEAAEVNGQLSSVASKKGYVYIVDGKKVDGINLTGAYKKYDVKIDRKDKSVSLTTKKKTDFDRICDVLNLTQYF